MTILSLVLFGSRARGDYESGSDVDILAINKRGKIQTKNIKNINFIVYPKEYLKLKAINGDLFLLHLVSESIIIFDSENHFAEIKSLFNYRDNYNHDKQQATDIGYFLVRYKSNFHNSHYLNKRMAWCARTILIAKAAEQRLPIFSAKALAEFTNSYEVFKIIKNKDSSSFNYEINDMFLNFLRKYGTPTEVISFKEVADYWKYFQRTKNTMGITTIKTLEMSPYASNSSYI